MDSLQLTHPENFCKFRFFHEKVCFSAPFVENKRGTLIEASRQQYRNRRSNRLDPSKELSFNVIKNEYTPKLFSDEPNQDHIEQEDEKNESLKDELFDQENNEEEDFEIPAFLRRQKF